MAKKSEQRVKRVKDEAKFEHAYLLFMNGVKQNEICTKVGISAPTLSAWVNDNDWRSIRAAKTVTRQSLINKVLTQIDTLLDKASGDDEEEKKGLEDRLSKLSSMIEKLDKQASVVDVVEVFIGFDSWLTERSSYDKEITVDFIKQVNRVQDMYVNERVARK